MPRERKKRSEPRKRTHGSLVQRGDSWRVRWREKGRRRSASFPDKATAERVLLRIIGDVAAGRGGLEPTPRDLPSLAELATKWLDRRVHTHRAWRGDRNMWNKDLKPIFGHLRPPEVDQARVRRLIEVKLAQGLSSTTVGHIVRLLSSFLSDVVEQGHIETNPAKGLPKSMRRLIRNAHDPKQTPFIEKQADIARIYAKLDEPFAAIFAVGALAGLRPGEIIGLEWGDVDLDAGRMLIQRQVRHGRVGPTKSGKPRLVPIIGPLAKILAERKLATGGVGLMFRPLTPWRRRSQYIKDSTVREALRVAFRACGLPDTWTWYTVSRHTYGGQHVMGGGSLATLREILGHSSVTVTERYGHLRPDLFKAEDLLKLTVTMSREAGEVIDLAAHRSKTDARGTTVGPAEVDEAATGGVSTEVR